LGQNAICLNARQVAILSTGLAAKNPWSANYNHDFASLNVIEKFSSNNFQSDLELISIVPDSSYTSCYISVLPFPGYNQCNAFLKPRIKVRNKGTTTITHFKLNCFDSPAIACGVNFYQEIFSGFYLMPGDTMSFTAANFARKGLAYSGSSSSFLSEFCFYTTVPNGETDKVVEDNEACFTSNFLITSLSEYAKSDFRLEIFPNPFATNVTVKSDVKISEIKLLNALGMLVSEQRLNGSESAIFTNDLAPGMYFLKIETEKGIATKKIVKQ